MLLPPEPVAGLLLTGGASRRMGRAKAGVHLDGVTLAERAAAALRPVVALAMEVGPGWTTLPSVADDLPGGGPLVAVTRGAARLGERGHAGGAVVLACDLPLVTSALVGFFVEHPAPGSVLPVHHGRPQYLCARWSAAALGHAAACAARGERAMKALAGWGDVTLVDEAEWVPAAGPVGADALLDVDTPEALAVVERRLVR